jgi:large subunit ribosomal protein L15
MGEFQTRPYETIIMSMIHDITSGAPRNKRSQRKGRGEGSGRGKTSGKGNKGAKARVGKYVKRGHEHGQTPIFRRFPKRGFSNENFERRFYIVNLAELEQFENGTIVDATALADAGLVPDNKLPVKILGDGEFTKKLTIVAGWYTKSAFEKIGQVGGTAQNAQGEPFAFPKPKKKFVPRDKEVAGGKKSKKGGDEAAPAPAAEAKPEGEKAE